MNLNFFRFAAHEDRLTEANNKVALVLASNTPFYPLYLYFILGRDGLPWLFLSAAALPFFSATIWISHRNGLWSRAWLCVFATLNSAYVTWLLGRPSGTAIFLIPCISLAVLSFRRRERVLMMALAAVPYVLLYVLHYHLPAPPATYTAAENNALLVLNEVSVASITAVMAYFFVNAREG